MVTLSSVSKVRSESLVLESLNKTKKLPAPVLDPDIALAIALSKPVPPTARTLQSLTDARDRRSHRQQEYSGFDIGFGDLKDLKYVRRRPRPQEVPSSLTPMMTPLMDTLL